MTTRNSRGQFTRKATAAENTDAKYEDFRSLFEEFGVLKYPLAGAVVNLDVTRFGVYGGDVTAAWLGLGALILSGSGFLSMVIAIVSGLVFAIHAFRAGAAAGKYVATGQFEDDYQRAKSWLSSKLDGSKAYVVSKFSTIH